MIVKGKIEIELNSIILYKIVDNDMVLYIKPCHSSRTVSVPDHF